MKSVRSIRVIYGLLALAIILCFLATTASAQSLGEMNAVTDGMNTLNSGPVGPGTGNYPMDRARNLGAPVYPTQPGAPGFPAQPGAPGAMPGMGIIEQIAKIKVVTGTRVFDAVSGELLDDVIEKMVPATDKEQYFDDGTHGDLQADDGQYARIDERSDVLGAGLQRVKESLVQAIVSAADLDPLDFFGYSLMSTERIAHVPRNRAWKIVPNPDGGPGFVLAEMATEKPLLVPKYRDQLAKRDDRVKNDWADRFLAEFRRSRDSLTSEFYALYIPTPPQKPTMQPPPAAQWMPFSDPGGTGQGTATGSTGRRPDARGPGGSRDRGVTGKPIGAASSRYF